MLKNKKTTYHIFAILLICSFFIGGKSLAATQISYPLQINITTDKNTVTADGIDNANLVVKIIDNNNLGVSNINVKFGTGGRDNIEPSQSLTNTDGIASFRISSNAEHNSVFKFSLKNPKTDDIYSSNPIQITFLNQSRFTKTLNSISDFRSNITTQKAVTYVVTPVVTVAAAASLSSPIIGIIDSIFPYLNYLINLILQLFGVRRKQKPWGVLYDSMTKQPIDLGIVRVFDAKTKKLIQTMVTDKSGRFGFSSMSGKYYLTASKSSYVFPSKLLKDAKVDGSYSSLYFGENVNLSNKERLNISIPIDLKSAIEARISLRDRFRSLSEKFSFPILVVSLILALFSLWISLNIFNEALVVLYILVIIFRKRTRGISIQPWGTVFDAKTGDPLMGIPLKIFDKKYGKLLETQVSGEKGRFSFILPKGEYYIRIGSVNYSFAKKAKQLGENENYYGGNFKIETNEVLRFNIPITKR